MTQELMLYVKFDENWLGGSGEGEKNMKRFNYDDAGRRTKTLFVAIVTDPSKIIYRNLYSLLKIT